MRGRRSILKNSHRSEVQVGVLPRCNQQHLLMIQSSTPSQKHYQQTPQKRKANVHFTSFLNSLKTYEKNSKSSLHFFLLLRVLWPMRCSGLITMSPSSFSWGVVDCSVLLVFPPSSRFVCLCESLLSHSRGAIYPTFIDLSLLLPLPAGDEWFFAPWDLAKRRKEF